MLSPACTTSSFPSRGKTRGSRWFSTASPGEVASFPTSRMNFFVAGKMGAKNVLTPKKKEKGMPIEIQVGPPGITISQGRTFMVTDQRGEIDPQTDAGVYAIDTRFVSSYRLFINREPLVLINSSQISFYAARWYLTNPKVSTESVFFFSSRRRHTSCSRDWSSDVCSSDLVVR